MTILYAIGIYLVIGIIVAIYHWRLCFSTFTWSFKDQLVATLVVIPIWPIFLFGGIYMSIVRKMKKWKKEKREKKKKNK